jgi:hypothetical protein
MNRHLLISVWKDSGACPWSWGQLWGQLLVVEFEFSGTIAHWDEYSVASLATTYELII